MSEGPWCRPAIPGDLGSCPRTLVLKELTLATWDRIRGTAIRPALPGDLGSGPRARRFDLLPRKTQAQVRDPTGSTSSPGYERSVRVLVGSTRGPGRLAPRSDGLRGQPALPGDSRSGPGSRGVDQLSQMTGAQVRGPTWSTSSPWQLGQGSEGLKCQPAIPGDSGPCPRTLVLDQLSLVTLT